MVNTRTLLLFLPLLVSAAPILQDAGIQPGIETRNLQDSTPLVNIALRNPMDDEAPPPVGPKPSMNQVPEKAGGGGEKAAPPVNMESKPRPQNVPVAAGGEKKAAVKPERDPAKSKYPPKSSNGRPKKGGQA